MLLRWRVMFQGKGGVVLWCRLHAVLGFAEWVVHAEHAGECGSWCALKVAWWQKTVHTAAIPRKQPSTTCTTNGCMSCVAADLS